QEDRHGEDADHVRDDGPMRASGRFGGAPGSDGPGVFGACGVQVSPAVQVAHADFTRQKIWGLTPSEFRSSRTTPSTVMRQPIRLPSPCTMMLALTDGSVVETVKVHGSAAALIWCV